MSKGNGIICQKATRLHRELVLPAFSNMQEILEDQLTGRTYIDGLSFKVKPYNMLDLFRGPRVLDRPFTYREHRADLWHQRRERVKRTLLKPIREGRWRLSLVWDGIRGIDHRDDCY
jgi:hypothetical protein